MLRFEALSFSSLFSLGLEAKTCKGHFDYRLFVIVKSREKSRQDGLFFDMPTTHYDI